MLEGGGGLFCSLVVVFCLCALQLAFYRTNRLVLRGLECATQEDMRLWHKERQA